MTHTSAVAESVWQAFKCDHWFIVYLDAGRARSFTKKVEIAKLINTNFCQKLSTKDRSSKKKERKLSKIAGAV